MPKMTYVTKKFSAASMATVDAAIKIIEEYQKQGFNLTLRQLYYQFVARGMTPNRQSEYKRLGSILNDARLAGLIDWSTIEDRTRNMKQNSHWETPEDIIEICAQQFAVDKWKTQPVRVEVWIEKEALTGVIEPVCKELDLPYFACRGYSSQSEQWRAGMRMLQYFEDDGQETVILHLGDHDPSGVDMTRDNADRLEMFSQNHVTVNRIALNMDQIHLYSPPPNPAKLTDTRARAYIEEYGDESWELDALEPTVIDAMIREHVDVYRVISKWDEAVRRENKAKAELDAVAYHWDAVIECINDRE